MSLRMSRLNIKLRSSLGLSYSIIRESVVLSFIVTIRCLWYPPWVHASAPWGQILLHMSPINRLISLSYSSLTKVLPLSNLSTPQSDICLRETALWRVLHILDCVKARAKLIFIIGFKCRSDIRIFPLTFKSIQLNSASTGRFCRPIFHGVY